MATAQQLRDALPRLSARDQEFATSLLTKFAHYGSFTPNQQPWVNTLVERAAQGPRPAAVQVGNLAGIQALFGKAKQHLKYPAIVLGCDGLGDDIRVSVASERSKYAGQLKVELANTFDFSEQWGERRRWLGRIELDGTFVPSGRCDARVAPRLAQFAANPAGVAGEHGRLTGNCCFCRKPLTDERSTAVGYGQKCASNFGLPWGARPEAICEPVAA